jgi:transposase
VVADRWFASSKTHHGCGGYLTNLSLGQRVWVCPACGRLVDRNANAARNLRDWTGPVADRDVQRGGVAAPVPLVGDHDGQARAPGVSVRGPVRPRAVARAYDTRTELSSREQGTPNRGTNW